VLNVGLMYAEGMSYVGTLTCTQDPCRYCGSPDDVIPARTFVVPHPEGPFDSERAARHHAQLLATKVYGASVHNVGFREVADGELLTIS
jgi:hypothetical protein